MFSSGLILSRVIRPLLRAGRGSLGDAGHARQDKERMDKAGKNIAEQDKRAKHLGIGRDQGEQADHQNQGPERMGLERAQFLERGVADVADHKKGDAGRADQGDAG